MTQCVVSNQILILYPSFKLGGPSYLLHNLILAFMRAAARLRAYACEGLAASHPTGLLSLYHSYPFVIS